MTLKVFYLDDEQDLLDVFVDLFHTPATEVTTFTQPDALMRALQAHRPDVVFIDFRMPNTTGDEIARTVEAVCPGLPKVLISGDITLKEEPLFIAKFEKPMNIEAVEAFLESIRKRKTA